MTIVIPLDHAEHVMAAAIGAYRRAESIRCGLDNNDGYAGFEKNGLSALANDIEAACAELAVCKWKNCYWSGSVHNYDEPDIAPNIHVRYTPRHNNCLIMREKDLQTKFEKHGFVLVTGVAPIMHLQGWIYGKDATNEEWIKNPGESKPAFFVPQTALTELYDEDAKAA